LSKHFYAFINYEDAYVQPLILTALKSRLPEGSYTLISSLSELPSPDSPLLQISSYETLPFDHILSHPSTSLGNAYIIRKALIRKHYLSTTAHAWITKNPSSILATNIKPACDFELDYAEFLDDALVEAFELRASLEENEGKESDAREWWILKPGMSDRGQGIRLFSTEVELQSIFEEWEADAPDSDDEEAETDDQLNKEQKSKAEAGGDYIVTSHLRHFIAQPYIHPPLLMTGNNHKFHIRTYVLAIGSLKVYVYNEMLALFASAPYTAPWTTTISSSSSSETQTIDLSPHLTNTCLQPSVSAGTVQLLSSLTLPPVLKDFIAKQIYATTGEIFEAAAKGMMVHFQTLPNAFEVFGLDFLVDEKGTAWLLECNAFPDFRQTGEELMGVVKGVWEGVVERAVGEFFGVEVEAGKGGEGKMVLVRDVDLGRR
jgi:tubulin--tyrosine ligase